MFNYQQLIEQYSIKSIKDINTLFWNEIAFDWIEKYKGMSEKHGVITLQNFYGYAFIIDDGNQHVSKGALPKEILESRVVGAFGISNTDINHDNRKMMRKWIGNSSEVFGSYGGNYDKGHFMPMV